MVYILKIVMILLIVASFFVANFIRKDFSETRNQDGYDELSVWRKLKFNVTTFFIFTSLASFIVFFVYMVFSKIIIG